MLTRKQIDKEIVSLLSLEIVYFCGESEKKTTDAEMTI